jgi:hypothetical protein
MGHHGDRSRLVTAAIALRFLVIGLAFLALGMGLAAFSLGREASPSSQPLPPALAQHLSGVQKQYPNARVRITPLSRAVPMPMQPYLSADGRRRMWFIAH